MSEVSAAVEVAVDPGTAFKVFTEEMDLWHVRSPISFYDSARAVAIRCEPAVGGRIVEVYEDGEFEIARITVWEPGKRLSWQDSHDDVEVDIWFEPTHAGTNVRVAARVPEGGIDRGGTSIVRVGPEWFGKWVARRDHVPREIVELPRLNLEVYYERPVTAMRWLAEAFGFELPPNLPADESNGVPTWIETRVGDAALMLFQLAGQPGTPTHIPFVYVDDLDAHLERAQRAGATIVEGIHQHGYRRYVCQDPEGHRWSFAQARPTMR
ncbi:MAG TPA: VOC family protein [Acidimicrobiales bacterium]